MNIATGCVLLGASTVIVLPLVLAVFLGWVPPLPQRDAGSPRLLASVVAAGHTAVVVEAVPHLAGVNGKVITVASSAAVMLSVVALVLGIAYDRASPRGRRGGEPAVRRP
ncbi:hypothetical protein U5640_22835 [Streptomyces sp. SS7]|uniref:hypothetical protein n=1 Tax=Streptomyces sp. SS7 TaxID=3108485 RepID=UPI0030ED9AC9